MYCRFMYDRNKRGWRTCQREKDVVLRSKLGEDFVFSTLPMHATTSMTKSWIYQRRKLKKKINCV